MIVSIALGILLGGALLIWAFFCLLAFAEEGNWVGGVFWGVVIPAAILYWVF